MTTTTRATQLTLWNLATPDAVAISPRTPAPRTSERKLRQALAAYRLDGPTLRYLAVTGADIRQAITNHGETLPPDLLALLDTWAALMRHAPGEPITRPSHLAALLLVEMGHLDHEQLHVACLDTKNHLQHITTATTASAATTTRRTSKKAASSAAPTPSPASPAGATLTVAQPQLKQALSSLLHAVAPKSTLPILAHILLVTDGPNRLSLSATNLEIAIVRSIPATVVAHGAMTVPARLLADVVGGLPNDPITITMEPRTQTLTLACGRFTANIKGSDAEEFPDLPSFTGQPPLAAFAPDALRCAISQVAFAAAATTTHPVLASVHIHLTGQTATFAAADGFRLAFRDLPLDAPVATQAVIIPAHALDTLAKLLADLDDSIELLMSADGNQVLFRTSSLALLSRVIDGTYPNVRTYLGLTAASVLEIDTKTLRKAVKLASFFASASANAIRLVLTPTSEGRGTLSLSANASEVGDNQSVHDGVLRGPSGAVALNVTFLADAIDAILTHSVAFHFTSDHQPIVLRGVGDDSYTHVAMPMSLR